MGMSLPSILNTTISPTRIGSLGELVRNNRSPRWNAGSIEPLKQTTIKWNWHTHTRLSRSMLPEDYNDGALTPCHNHQTFPNHKRRGHYHAKAEKLVKKLNKKNRKQLVHSDDQNIHAAQFKPTWRLFIRWNSSKAEPNILKGEIVETARNIALTNATGHPRVWRVKQVFDLALARQLFPSSDGWTKLAVYCFFFFYFYRKMF